MPPRKKKRADVDDEAATESISSIVRGIISSGVLTKSKRRRNSLTQEAKIADTSANTTGKKISRGRRDEETKASESAGSSVRRTASRGRRSKETRTSESAGSSVRRTASRGRRDEETKASLLQRWIVKYSPT